MLEWLPQETIVFDGAQAEITAAIRLRGDALYLGWDILCFGRRAAGESFDSGSIKLRTEIWRDGKRLWNEYARLAGGHALLRAPAVCDGYAVCATMLLAGAAIDKDLLRRLRQVTAADGLRYGLTTLPGMLVARCLAPFAEPARHYFTALWHLLRPALLGRAATAPRIWST
jgi:urease accessory protein